MYIGGKQTRPDGGARLRRRSGGQAGLGGRKDIRNAVEAGQQGDRLGLGDRPQSGAGALLHRRESRRPRVCGIRGARRSLGKSTPRSRRLFFYAGFADKYDGAVRAGPAKFVTLAMNEPYGVVGLVCPNEAPLLAHGLASSPPPSPSATAVVVVPSAAHPLAATDFYSVLDTSDLPARRRQHRHRRGRYGLAQTLAEHDGVDALWRAGPRGGREAAGGGRRRQPQTHVDAGRRRRLDAKRAGPRVSAPRLSDQDDLDALRGITDLLRLTADGG